MTLRYVEEFPDRHGHVRRYFRRRRGDKRIPLPGEPGSREFMDAYNSAIAGPREPIGIDLNDPRSLAAAVGLYLASETFASLAKDTRAMRRRELERFRGEHGHRTLSKLDQGAIERIIAKKRPHPARNFLKAVSPLLDWCKTEKLIATNPAKGIERPKLPKSDGFRTWTDDLVTEYRKHHKVGTKARRALEVLVNVGAARVDTAVLGRQHVRNGFLVYRRHKTGVLVQIPVLPDLQGVIDEMDGSGDLAFIATEQGKPYTKESFGNLFRDWCDEAKIPKGYGAHGLRKYSASHRAELGATAPQLMAWYGWLTMREAERYTKAADRKRMAVALGNLENPGFPTPNPGWEKSQKP